MPTVFTIGYEQARQAAVVGALRDPGVEVLAYIRYLPLSRPSSSLRTNKFSMTGFEEGDGRPSA